MKRWRPVGLNYVPGSLQIRHLLDVIVYDVGLEEVEKHVVQPLTGLAPGSLPGLHGAPAGLFRPLVRP